MGVGLEMVLLALGFPREMESCLEFRGRDGGCGIRGLEPGGSEVKASAYNVGDLGSIPGPGKSGLHAHGKGERVIALEI